MTDIDPAYAAGLAADGLARFVDSQGRAWLIPLNGIYGRTDGARNIIDLSDADAVYASAAASTPDRFDRVLDEYLASRPPKLPTEHGALIRVAETRGNKPRGVYMRQGWDSLPWRSIDGTGWLRDDQIVAWNPVDIVDREA